MTDNVISLFAKKNITDIKETPEETLKIFHEKLDKVLDDYNYLNAHEKFQVLESVISMNKSIFELYINLKRSSLSE